MSLAGKAVVVIGGSSGIGLATAKAALVQRAAVVIAGRTEAKLERARAELTGDLRAVVLDVTRERDVKRFFEQIGGFDHLVTTAAGFEHGPFPELAPAHARAFFDGKFWGQYYAAHYAAPHLRHGGSITFLAGIASRKVLPGFAVSAAVNGAIEALARTIALELAPIRVNVVSPGLIVTPVYDAMPEAARDKLFQSFAAKLPVKRVGQPEEVAATVLYLMQNGYTTGTVIDVDGGLLVS